MATTARTRPNPAEQSRPALSLEGLMDRVLQETEKLRISKALVPTDKPPALAPLITELVASLPAELKSDLDADHDILLARLEALLEPEVDYSVSAVLHAPEVAKARAFAEDTAKYLAMVNEDHGRDTAFDHKLYMQWATRDSIIASYRKAGRNVREMPLYKLLVEENYGTFGGTPILAAEFDEVLSGTPADLELLDVIGQIGQAGHFEWLVNVGPGFFGVGSWEELPTTQKKLKELATSGAMSAYMEFRLKPWSRYVCLCLPGLYGTAPFDPDGNPASDLPGFTEVVDSENDLVVNSAAAAMTSCIVRSMAKTDWPVNLVGETFGGKREGLVRIKLGENTREERHNATTELPIPDSIELVLVDKFGVTPALAKKDSNIAVFFGAATTSRAVRGLDSKTNADAEMHTRLPNLMLANRFAHYIKALHRGLIGCGKSAEEVETFMQTWANQWVLQNPEGASEAAKADRPFREVVVVVQKMPEKPGYLDATVTFVPHYRVTAIKSSILIEADPSPDGSAE